MECGVAKQEEGDRPRPTLNAAPRALLGAAPLAQAQPGALGILLRQALGGFAEVDSLAPGMPAAECGRIRAGDRLVSVDGRRVDGLTLGAVHELINGPAGCGVELVFCPEGADVRAAAGGRSGVADSRDAQRTDFFGAISSACYSMASPHSAGGGSKGATPRQSLEQVRAGDGGAALNSSVDGGSWEYRVTLVRAPLRASRQC